MPDVLHVSNTNRYHRPPEETEEEFTAFLLDELEATIVQAGPDTVAMVILEPVQNAGGSFTPPAGYFEGVRALCDEHGILLCADEVITGFGRTGHWFASERYDIRPDLITSAKGLSSAYAAIGAVIASERVMEPFTKPGEMYTHGMTFGGHPVQAAVALKNIEIMKRERHRRARARARAGLPRDARAAARPADRGRRARLRLLLRDRAGQGPETRAGFSDDECEDLLRGFMSPQLFERGLICRADDRGDPVVQISPPLVAGQAEFDEIAGTLGAVLEEAGEPTCAERPRYLIPTTIESGPSRCSTYVSRKPASGIHSCSSRRRCSRSRRGSR